MRAENSPTTTFTADGDRELKTSSTATSPPAEQTVESGTPPQERIVALDVLRGIAIIGTLASNAWIFTMWAGSPAGSAFGQWVSETSRWLPNGKFLGLLTIMFGIGLEIQRQSARRAGKKWPGKYPIRAGLLFLDGAINFIFVVQFDVLRGYAVVGLLVAFLLLLNEKVQWWVIGVFFSLHIFFMFFVGMGSGRREGEYTIERNGEIIGRGSGDIRGERIAGFDASQLDGEFSEQIDNVANQSYWATVSDNVTGFFHALGPNSVFFTILFMGTALFLLGGKLFRHGIFNPENKKLRLILIGVALAIVPLDFILGATDVMPAQIQSLSRYATSPVIAIGILAGVGQFYSTRSQPRFIGNRLREIGRMALSCYLLQNILGVIAMYTIFAEGRGPNINNALLTWLFIAVLSVLLSVFAHFWLRRFERGPFELVWNWSYRKLGGN